MTERKPADVNFESWIDRQIREATERGEFDNLPGTGKPLPGGPVEEQWWLKDYLRRETLVLHALKPLVAVNLVEKYDLHARVSGGGLTGQAGAIRMAVARALVRIDESLRGLLGREGYLTRDARMVERKKYGQPGARKRFQFSKR